MTEYTTFEHDVLVIGAGSERGHSCPHERLFDAKNIFRLDEFFAGGTGDADRSVRVPFND